MENIIAEDYQESAGYCELNAYETKIADKLNQANSYSTSHCGRFKFIFITWLC